MSQVRSQLVSVLVTRIAAALLQAVGFLVFSRVVTVSEVGMVAVVISAGSFVALLTDLGIATFLNTGRARPQSDELVRRALAINYETAGALIVIGVAVVAVLIGLGILPWPLLFLAAALPLERSTETRLSVSFADGHRLTPAVSIVGRRLVGVIVLLAMIILGADGVLAYCLSQLAGNLAGSAHVSYAVRKLVGPGAMASRREVLRLSWPFWLSGVLNQIRILDVSIVAALGSTLAAGLYAAALRLTNPILLLPNAISSVVMPHATRASPASTLRLANRLTLIFVLLLVGFIPVFIFSTEVVVLLLGPSFAAAGPVLSFALLGVPFAALTRPLTAVLQAWGAGRFVAANAAIFAVLMIVGLVIGVALGGALGAALASSVVSIVRSAVIAIAMQRRARELMALEDV